MAYESVIGPIAGKKTTTELVRQLSRNAGLFKMITEAIKPFSLGFGKFGIEPDLLGDKPAMIFVEHLAERLSAVAGGPGAFVDTDAFQTYVDASLDDVLSHDLALRLDGVFQPIKPHTMAQLAFLYDLLDPTIPLLIGIGPTGTSKTFLAIATALNQLERGNVKHILITKPHEMLQGEQMTASKRAEMERDEQFEIYYDILNELVGSDTINSLIERRHIEIAPLGWLRGRTLPDSFILIDEAHNIDKHWMRLAVTRAGKNARTIITGDTTQSTLANGEMSGLTHLLGMIKGRDIARVHKFSPKDIVRNATVAQLETLYAAAGERDLDLSLHRD